VGALGSCITEALHQSSRASSSRITSRHCHNCSPLKILGRGCGDSRTGSSKHSRFAHHASPMIRGARIKPRRGRWNERRGACR